MFMWMTDKMMSKESEVLIGLSAEVTRVLERGTCLYLGHNDSGLVGDQSDCHPLLCWQVTGMFTQPGSGRRYFFTAKQPWSVFNHINSGTINVINNNNNNNNIEHF